MTAVKLIAMLIVDGVAMTIQAGTADEPFKTELRLSGEFIKPKKDVWDNGYGAEAQYVIWMDKNFGVALAAGISKWKTTDDTAAGVTDPYTITAAKLDGDATFYPLGGSLLYRLSIAEKATLTLEGGVRYVIADSDVHVRAAAFQSDYWGDVYIADADQSTVTFDNAFIGRVGADLDIGFSESAGLFLGVGYDFDIGTGTVSGFNEDWGDYHLAAFFARIGAEMKF